MKWKLPIAAVAVVAIAALVTFNPWARSHARTLWSRVLSGGHEAHAAVLDPGPKPPAKVFDGTIELDSQEAAAIGVALAPVSAQTDPVHLSVNGRTDYDPNTLNKVRPKFKSKIDHVYVGIGRRVNAGDPLVDLFSAELALAKGGYENKVAQWKHDKAELDRATELLKTNAVSQQQFLLISNDEKKSDTEAKISRDMLLVYGLTEAEIDGVPKEDGTKKAMMTLRAPSAGVVIARDAVQGNLADDNDVLLTIAPLDHFYVYGYVYPSDASRVSLGLDWVIDCPFAGMKQRAKILSITSEIDKETKTLRIRTLIENTENRIKADMLVTGYVEIPPPPGHHHTVIPRLAMVSSDGGDYAFVLIPNASADDKGAMRFERRRVRVIHEGSEGVVVAESGKEGQDLKPGEQVATKGSLLLQQIYEDSVALNAGGPR